MQQSAGNMVNRLNDIVWLLNPKHDSIQELIQRLEEYANEMAHAKNMLVTVNAPAGLDEYSLPVESRRNIYLFCKEAINNAVKYSEGTLLELIFNDKNGILEFCVSDNGKGFDPDTVRRGNGLGNMRKRAEEAGATFHIQSALQSGTSVSFQVPTP
jgi:signal transduction histidine kinase